jgi:excisionase family DNA binding protein
VIISVVYLLLRCLLGCLTVLARDEVTKDVELLVLRHEFASSTTGNVNGRTPRRDNDRPAAPAARAQARTSHPAPRGSDAAPPGDNTTTERVGQNSPGGRLAYSVDEAARLTGLSRDLLYDEMRRGNLTYVKVGRPRLITRLSSVSGQEREHAARRDQVTGQCRRVGKLPVHPLETLHETLSFALWGTCVRCCARGGSWPGYEEASAVP